MKPEKGFSLIELLVVVLIIGLAVSLISINASTTDSSYQLRQSARDFANQTSLLAEEAVLSRQQWGVDLFYDHGDQGQRAFYRWLRLEGESWQVVTPEGFASEQGFASSLTLILEVEGQPREIEYSRSRESSELKPDIWLLSTGEISPFRLTIEPLEENQQALTVVGDGLGRIWIEQSNAL